MTSIKQHSIIDISINSIKHTSIKMTRSHKFNDKVHHSGVTEGTAPQEEHLPRFFAKHGHPGEDPKKTKKNGAGKGNWGGPGEEVDDEEFNFANARRRSNSSSFSKGLNDFKTKFEVNEPEPVFEENIHGPTEPVDDDLTKTDSSSTGSSSHDDAKSV
ncbi:hypothetical protein NKR23_g1440 [Pleurostoma richardsiae]|uniref:Uncharacterized protein n=1 Tax=Pleurostoma richardsiae TaxID=41990 RepID=A0AA38RT86_9PEZI|nr:hypothetical protein NKR23_g1440 [Pleurostoma richardsiae]